MFRILAGAIISFALSFLSPGLYYFWCADYMAGIYSNHYTYTFTANERSYYLLPATYDQWYAFRDGVTENYGKKISDKKGLVVLNGIAGNEFELKSAFSYYQMKPTSTQGYFELEKVEKPQVNPYLYLLRYLAIYLLLIAFPLILGYTINRYLLHINTKWLNAITVCSTVLGFVVTCMYLRDWWTLFTGWVL